MEKNIISVILLTAFVFTGLSYSQSRFEKRLESSENALQEVAKQIPDSILNKALGIAVIPNVVRVGAGVGGFRGQGVLSVKNENGCWSFPSFVSFNGASVGLQAGGQRSDVVLVFMSKKSIDMFADGSLELNAGISAEAGPLQANKSITKKADIYTYSRSEGVYKGVTLKGSTVGIDNSANENFYDSKDIEFNAIIENKVANVPQRAQDFAKSIADKTGGC